MGFSEEVANHLGVPRSAISLIETGARKVDALELTKLAKLYQRGVAELTGEESPRAESVYITDGRSRGGRSSRRRISLKS